MIPDPASHPTLYIILAIVFVLLLVARRVRPIRVVVNIAITLLMVGTLLILLNQRSRFDPYFARVAELLDIGDQQVVGDEVRIRMAPDGHFWARATINGVPRRLLIDSGATITALSNTTVAASGITIEDEMFPIVLKTANGTVSARGATVNELRFGTIVARDLPVVTSPAFGDTNVLGMNFLSRLASWRVEGRTLILVPHRPQDPGGA
ncbi:TIGR02281 family clan AA aspartic protease [Hephaestia sp. GCM10023244]|uniref:retropepsin-like aspartic protease family protein n=1 Tax=unclassified Hephaestia TaxID=2631281 RepID=UPI0020778B8E|nr:TIGR02281 family clan AA aspartic protease [Hephaestia sp. MAHUQ-44]MCM8731317.1 TIGR02281 family clan AA aspartic protease [Hephaestia sp. MAHUQ-44]